MVAAVEFTKPGRGAWSAVGGALNLDGTKPGPYYRAPHPDQDPDKRIGRDVAAKVKDRKTHAVHINDYAVWRGAFEIQRHLRSLGYAVDVDGIWGPQTDAQVKSWQQHVKVDWSGKPMKVDGIYGQQTARTLWEPLLKAELDTRTAFMRHYRPVIHDLCRATVILESGWDIAAVGGITPRDVGLGQINQDAWPDMGLDESFRPRNVFKFKIDFILSNSRYALGDWPLTIASYNGGPGQAEQWHNAGRPRGWWADRYLTGMRKHLTHPLLLDALAEYA